MHKGQKLVAHPALLRPKWQSTGVGAASANAKDRQSIACAPLRAYALGHKVQHNGVVGTLQGEDKVGGCVIGQGYYVHDVGVNVLNRPAILRCGVSCHWHLPHLRLGQGKGARIPQNDREHRPGCAGYVLKEQGGGIAPCEAHKSGLIPDPCLKDTGAVAHAGRPRLCCPLKGVPGLEKAFHIPWGHGKKCLKALLEKALPLCLFFSLIAPLRGSPLHCVRRPSLRETSLPEHHGSGVGLPGPCRMWRRGLGGKGCRNRGPLRHPQKKDKHGKDTGKSRAQLLQGMPFPLATWQTHAFQKQDTHLTQVARTQCFLVLFLRRVHPAPLPGPLSAHLPARLLDRLPGLR